MRSIGEVGVEQPVRETQQLLYKGDTTPYHNMDTQVDNSKCVCVCIEYTKA